jgi:hypothetical protein
MVQALAPDRADHALHVGPLPWRSRSREYFLNLHVLYLLSESIAENLIAIAEQIAGNLIKRKGLAQLVSRPFRGGMRGDIEVHHPTPVMRQHQKHVQHRNRIVGTVKKSTDTRFLTRLFRKVSHVCEGGLRSRTMYLATLVSLIWMPSLSNSPWMWRRPKADFRGSSCG